MFSRSTPTNTSLLVLDDRRRLQKLTRENAHSFPHEHLRAARLSVTDLLHNGVVSDPDDLRRLGFDAYDLVSDPLLLQSSIDAFGAILSGRFLRTRGRGAFAGRKRSPACA